MRVMVLVAVLMWARAAGADETPWSKGVTEQRREQAKGALDAGNELFLHQQYREALVKYDEALAAWDHPAIRFNAVRCLIALDRPLDAQQYLDRALAYGKAPFEEALYTEALNYQKLLAGQIADLEIQCKQPAVEVKLDGASVLKCPGAIARKLLPGTHVVVGTKAGFMTQSQDIIALPGKRQTVTVELATLEQATVYKTRWKTWQPWTVAASGLVVAGIGVLLNVQSHNDQDRLQRALDNACSGMVCTRQAYLAVDFENRQDAAVLKNRVGIGLTVLGGAVVATGVVGVILNRPKAVPRERRDAVHVAPVITRGTAGLAIGGSF